MNNLSTSVSDVRPNDLKNNISRLNSHSRSLCTESTESRSKEMKSACMELESLFIEQLLKEMRATVQKSGFLDGGQAEEVFTSIMDVELSKSIALNGGFGIADRMFEQLSENHEKMVQKCRQDFKIIKDYLKTADI